jgi:hypothetical protein
MTIHATDVYDRLFCMREWKGNPASESLLGMGAVNHGPVVDPVLSQDGGGLMAQSVQPLAHKAA